MQVSRERIAQTVPKYLNYVLLRLKNGYTISEDEMMFTHQYYQRFCEEYSFDFLSRNAFYSEMARRGILAKSIWDKKRGKVVSIRDLNDKPTIQLALDKWVDTSAVHGSIMEINGEKYQVTIKLVKLQPYDKQTK